MTENVPSTASGSNFNRTTLCKQCDIKPTIYTCPACSVRTCSMICSARHKQFTPCTGKRNRVVHIPMNQYSWGSLMQDYTYLEEVNRSLIEARRITPTSAISITPIRPDGNVQRDELIQKAAKANVRLILMPEGMSRRRINSTCLTRKGHMSWTMEWVFRISNQDSSQALHSGPGKQTHLIHQIPSTKSLRNILTEVLSFKKLQLDKVVRGKILSTLTTSQPDTDNPTFESEFVVVLFIEPSCKLTEHPNSPSDAPLAASSSSQIHHFHLLNLESNLSEALSGTTIVEWPVIEIWPVKVWEKEIGLGRVQIVPKSTFVGRETDSGWGDKRRRICEQNNQKPNAERTGEASATGESVDLQGMTASLVHYSESPLVDYSSSVEDVET